MTNMTRLLGGAAFVLACQLGTTARAQSDDWKEKTISPVTNPIFFEDPQVNTEIRPIFMQHNIDKDFLTGGGDVRVYAVQARWAVTDRFAIIATKDGFVEFNPKTALQHENGWADLAAGLKYALIDNKEKQFILTPGLTFELPTGNERVFQGNGKGEWNVFVSSQKGWGNCHLTGNVGLRVPNDFNKETSQAHYSLQLDYYTCRWFIPFVSANGFSVMTGGNVLPLDVEGYDLINFGSSKAGGFTQIALGGGFRSRLHKNVDLGFAYERGVTGPEGLFDDRFTVDMIIRF